MARIAIILALPIEYNTSSMLRCRSIISALVEIGNEIKIYCPNPDISSKYYNVEKRDFPGIELFRIGKKMRVTQSDNVSSEGKRTLKSRILKIGLDLFRKVDVFGSSLMYLPERKNISKDISVGNFDILMSFSDPMPAHMIAKYVKRHNPELRYIQQWGDPLASDTISKISQPVWVRKMIENSLLKPANKVCYVSPFTCDEQKALFPRQANKMFFLPTPSIEYVEEKKESDRLSVGYFGSYNSIARNLQPFYIAARQIKDVDFYIIGDSDIHLQSTPNITVLSRVSPEELNSYVNKVDVIVCLMNLKGNQIPGKVYHDASSSKDILLIKDGEYGDAIQEFFQKYNHYTFVDNDAHSICKALNHYLDNGVPVREAVKEFRADYIAKELL